jgi:site-specific DNA-methyltransferase (adenine-specific)
MTIIKGNCLTEMAKMAENSIDFIVTDPPYGLHFMNKQWDIDTPGNEIWQQASRIAKPGAMLAAFGGSRTHHRLMCALEDAGWEIRDVIMWLYGSGFPKSHNISKAIDKMKGYKREIVGIKPGHEGFENNKNHSLNDGWSRPWAKDPEKVKLYHCQTKGNSDLAKKFDDYGTALKPAYEPIIIAMKPLEGTFAQNAEKWGVAGINVDESRISGDKLSVPNPTFNSSTGKTYQMKCGKDRNDEMSDNSKGRWPANIILDEEAAEQLDQMSGILKSGSGDKHSKTQLGGYQGGFKPLSGIKNYKSDSGGASRFFYCAKASSSERNRGLGDAKQTISMPNGTLTLDIKNTHPTVKPISLMKYIIKLLAPPGNPTLLDPFAGSGSTLVAAAELGINAIGFELSEEYCEIARKRIEFTKLQKEKETEQMDLFHNEMKKK